MILPTKQLQKQYEAVCNQYVQKFCRKQKIQFNYWLSDKVGQIAVCGDYYLDFQDIVYDINTQQPKGLIFIKWSVKPIHRFSVDGM
jgi:hypothetical protein